MKRYMNVSGGRRARRECGLASRPLNVKSRESAQSAIHFGLPVLAGIFASAHQPADDELSPSPSPHLKSPGCAQCRALTRSNGRLATSTRTHDCLRPIQLYYGPMGFNEKGISVALSAGVASGGAFGSDVQRNGAARHSLERLS